MFTVLVNQDHVEVGAIRVDRDRKDLDNILDYLAVNSPFTVRDSRLQKSVHVVPLQVTVMALITTKLMLLGLK